MKSPILVLAFACVCLGAELCSAALLVPLRNGAVQVALIDGDWPADGSNWVRTNETLVALFYVTASQADADFSPGQRVQVHNLANRQIVSGIVVPRLDTHDDRNQLGIFAKKAPSSVDYERAIRWSALPLVMGPDQQDPTIPYVGPLVEQVVVPEPASLLIWSLIAGVAALSSIAYRRR